MYVSCIFVNTLCCGLYIHFYISVMAQNKRKNPFTHEDKLETKHKEGTDSVPLHPAGISILTKNDIYSFYFIIIIFVYSFFSFSLLRTQTDRTMRMLMNPPREPKSLSGMPPLPLPHASFNFTHSSPLTIPQYSSRFIITPLVSQPWFFVTSSPPLINFPCRSFP